MAQMTQPDRCVLGMQPMSEIPQLRNDSDPDRDQGFGPAMKASGSVPGIETARQYRLAWLPRDLAGGLALSALLVPVGIAYAAASGVPGKDELRRFELLDQLGEQSFYPTLAAAVDWYLAQYRLDWKP